MNFVDRDLVCTTCGATFVFSAGEQQYHQMKGFVNLPKNCRQCRARRNYGIRARAETLVKCGECGKETSIPFKPVKNMPVYCAECFQKRKRQKPVVTSNATNSVGV